MTKYPYNSIEYNDEDTIKIKTKLNGDVIVIVVRNNFLDKFPDMIKKSIEMDSKKPFNPEEPNFYAMQYFGDILSYIHNIKGPAIYYEDETKRQISDYFIDGKIYKPGDGETDLDVINQWKNDGFGNHYKQEFEKWLDTPDEDDNTTK